MQVHLQGIDHAYTDYVGYIEHASHYVTVEVTVRNRLGKEVAYRKGCPADTNLFNLEKDLERHLPGNLTDIVLYAPWSRLWARNPPWPDTAGDRIAKENLNGVLAGNLLSHIHELLLIAARYFIVKCTLRGNLWTSDFHLHQGLSELLGSNRSRLTDPATFYEGIRRQFALYDEPILPPVLRNLTN